MMKIVVTIDGVSSTAFMTSEGKVMQDEFRLSAFFYCAIEKLRHNESANDIMTRLDISVEELNEFTSSFIVKEDTDNVN